LQRTEFAFAVHRDQHSAPAARDTLINVLNACAPDRRRHRGGLMNDQREFPAEPSRLERLDAAW